MTRAVWGGAGSRASPSPTGAHLDLLSSTKIRFSFICMSVALYRAVNSSNPTGRVSWALMFLAIGVSLVVITCRPFDRMAASLPMPEIRRAPTDVLDRSAKEELWAPFIDANPAIRSAIHDRSTFDGEYSDQEHQALLQARVILHPAAFSSLLHRIGRALDAGRLRQYHPAVYPIEERADDVRNLPREGPWGDEVVAYFQDVETRDCSCCKLTSHGSAEAVGHRSRSSIPEWSAVDRAFPSARVLA